MSRVLIMYFTKYGSTKKYASWLAEELNGDIFPINKVKQQDLSNYETIILGSALYAGSIKGVDLLVKNYEQIKGKKIVIFTCGLADYSKPENMDTIRKRLETIIPKELFDCIKLFCLRGGIDYQKLNVPHKLLMGMLNRMMKKKKPAQISEESKIFRETYGKSIDFTGKDNLKGIIDYCK